MRLFILESQFSDQEDGAARGMILIYALEAILLF